MRYHISSCFNSGLSSLYYPFLRHKLPSEMKTRQIWFSLFSYISLISFAQILYYQGHACVLVATRLLFLLSQTTPSPPPSCKDFWHICHCCVCQLFQCSGMEIIQIPLFLYCKWSNFISTLYGVITIILSSFSVCHFIIFIETEGKVLASVFVPAYFFLNVLLNLSV